ncbi:MAG TPA: SDR family oxidoreductase [Steroidobacteraceae bacterium]|jgi:NAD(P)-dependent dehydrogenase (short-subunit alcohol dehydrogenase family)|nr:SDR family oxidoreductase [Steroidobacteraceae bacterium]
MGDMLKGQVAIVTGAGRGFGRAIAMRYAGEGAAVTVTSRSAAELESAIEDIGRIGGRAIAVQGDVTNPEDVDRVVATTEQQLGPVSILVSNAGVPGPFGPVWSVNPEQWVAAQYVHIRAPFYYMQRVMPGMTQRRAGTVILVSAIASRIVAPYLSAYCLGKIAQTRLAAVAAAEAREFGVNVYSIDPGFVYTGMAEDTANHPDAQRWLPGMVDRLRSVRESPHRNADLVRCAQRCLDLASGRYGALSGRYLELGDDLDAALRDAAAASAGKAAAH